MEHDQYQKEVEPFISVASLGEYWEMEYPGFGDEVSDQPENSLVERIIALQVAYRVVWNSTGPCQSISETLREMIAEGLELLDNIKGEGFSKKINPGYNAD